MIRTAEANFFFKEII